MLTMFQVCFYVGILMMLLSFFVGSVFHLVDFDGFDLDFDVFGLDINIPISPMLFTVFLTVYGGIGWILIMESNRILIPFIIGIALLAGICCYLFLFFLVVRPLRNAQNTSAPDLEELVGLPAEVSETIYEKGFGEIRYFVNGNSYSAPAKGNNEQEIKAGTKVAICWIKDHVFYVMGMKESFEPSTEE